MWWSPHLCWVLAEPGEFSGQEGSGHPLLGDLPWLGGRYGVGCSGESAPPCDHSREDTASGMLAVQLQAEVGLGGVTDGDSGGLGSFCRAGEP